MNVPLTNMRSLSKISVLVVAILLFSIVAMGQATVTHEDVHGMHPYSEAITAFKTEGILQGYADGLFRPDHTVNRAEFMKIVLMVNHIESGGQDCFPDVAQEWFAPWVCAAVERGIVSGYSDGLFRPERTISFVEAAKMLVKASGDTQSEGKPWYRGYTEFLASKKSIPPSISGFDHLVTRGETAAMAWLLRPEDDYGKKDMQSESLDYEKIKTFTESQRDYTLDFEGAGKKVVLSGTRMDVLNFPYVRETDTFERKNPGGYEEFSLMTSAQIKAYEKQLTVPVHTEGGTTTVWTTCTTDTRLLAENLTGKTLTCTNYHQEVGSNGPANWLAPHTHCFIPLSKDAYLAYRIPMSALDSGTDGCRQLRMWGIRSVHLQ